MSVIFRKNQFSFSVKILLFCYCRERVNTHLLKNWKILFRLPSLSKVRHNCNMHLWYSILFNPFAPGDFAKKRVLKLVEWSLSCYKELKLTTNWFTGHTLRGLLILMQNISLRSSGMRRKQNFKIVFGFKSDTAVLTFTFRFLSSLLFSLFLPHFFVSCWAFSRLHFGGKSS